jgi:hypothetical protein
MSDTNHEETKKAKKEEDQSCLLLFVVFVSSWFTPLLQRRLLRFRANSRSTNAMAHYASGNFGLTEDLDESREFLIPISRDLGSIEKRRDEGWKLGVDMRFSSGLQKSFRGFD